MVRYRLERLQNVVDLGPGETPAKRTWLRAVVSWGVAFLFLLLAVLSPIADLITIATAALGIEIPRWSGDWWSTQHAHGLVVVAIFIAGRVLYGEYRLWKHYQAAMPHFHYLVHRFRDRLAADVVDALRDGDLLTLGRLLFRSLDSAAVLFEQLAYRGEIHVSLLIPIAIGKDQVTHLQVACWSPTTGKELSRVRRDPGSIPRASCLSIEGSLAGYVHTTRHSILIRDLDQLVRESSSKPPFEIVNSHTRSKEDTLKYVRSHISVPVVLNKAPWGVLCIDCSVPDEFHTGYIEIARMCADLVAIPLKLAKMDTY